MTFSQQSHTYQFDPGWTHVVPLLVGTGMNVMFYNSVTGAFTVVYFKNAIPATGTPCATDDMNCIMNGGVVRPDNPYHCDSRDIACVSTLGQLRQYPPLP
jgi:hypothetical protein